MFANNNLPRYYFGDNSAQQKGNVTSPGNRSNYFNQMDKEQEISHPESEVNVCQSKDTNLPLTSVVEELYLSEPNLSRIPSPSSSVASNKKLEWDSGADIGYNVQDSLKHSRKCKSFPILHVDLSPISHIISTSITAKMIDTDQSVEKRPLKLNKKIESFQHSTPIERGITTKLTMSIYDENNSEIHSERKSKSKNRIIPKASNIDECLQTTLINISSKSVQTDDEHLVSAGNKKLDKSKVNRSQQTDAMSLASEHTSTAGSSSQTSSFQYIPGSDVASRTPSDNHSDASKSNSNKSIPKSITPSINKSEPTNATASNTNLKSQVSSRSQTNSSHSSKSRSHLSESSNNSPLGKMIATQQSRNLIADIDKSLYLLQRFLKSKNYNNDTKKHYAKKIVNKIIQNKYTDDTSVSNKSDGSSCCCTSDSSTERKKDSGATTNKTGKNTNESGNVSEDTGGQSLKLKQSAEISGEVLQDNKNQLESLNPDFVDCAIQCDPYQSYFVDQNYPSNQKSPIDHGTTISTEFGIKLSLKDGTNRHTKCKSRENLTENISSADFYSDTSSKNWKEEKTLSEKLFEAKKKYSSSSEATTRNNSLNNKPKQRLSAGSSQHKTDFLIEHSKKERKRQLSWINNEIVYLRELKNLLQSKDVTSDTSNDATEKFEASLKDIRSKLGQYQNSESDHSHSHTSSFNINNLSKYLTNDQIKFLIKHDASKIHHHTCACCKSQSQRLDSSSKPSNIDQSQTTGNKSSVPDTVLSEIHGFSYSSHDYNVKKPPKSSSKESVTDQTKILKPIEMLDAGIQCTIRKKKKTLTNGTQISEISSSVCTEVSKENVSDINEGICISVENVYNSTNVEETTTKTSTSDSSSQVNKSTRSQRFGKENRGAQSSRGQRSHSARDNKDPLAYYLTFEEKTPSDLSQNQEKNTLPNVVVKVPKLRKVVKDTTDQNVPDYTLQEYLSQNRPDFVQLAEWRRHHVADPRGKQPKTFFTCRELKEITWKQYKNLPEVQNKIKDIKIENQRRHNRFMASMFSKKLQKKTLQGQISLSTCISVMSSSS